MSGWVGVTDGTEPEIYVGRGSAFLLAALYQEKVRVKGAVLRMWPLSGGTGVCQAPGQPCAQGKIGLMAPLSQEERDTAYEWLHLLEEGKPLCPVYWHDWVTLEDGAVPVLLAAPWSEDMSVILPLYRETTQGTRT